MPLARRDVIHQLACHRYLGHGVFTERNANRVAQALVHECAYAHGTFHAAVFAKTGLGHAQVQRKMHLLGIHGDHKAAHGLHHHHHIAGFHRDDHIVKILGHKHAPEFHHTLHHALWSVAITAHDAVAERPMVHA